MDLLDRVGEKSRNKNTSDRMGLFQPQRRKAATLLLARLFASLRSCRFGSDAGVPLCAEDDVVHVVSETSVYCIPRFAIAGAIGFDQALIS